MSLKYTKDIKRELWIKNIMYPFGSIVLDEIVSKIEWDTYQFTGETLCKYEDEDENDFSYSYQNNAEITKFINIEGIGKSPEFPYFIIGGTACEMYEHFFPQVGKIHDIVDPTSDIDIQLNYPAFYTENKEDYIIVKKDSNLSIDYTAWLFNEIVRLTKKIKKHFKDSIFSLPTDGNIEIKKADIKEEIGPLLVTRVILNDQNMIKVQVSTQIEDISDHFLEFILPIASNLFVNTDGSKSNYVIENSLIVQSPVYLFIEQLKALIDRKGLAKDEYEHKHKLYNHCARVLYLIKVINFLKNKDLIIQVFIPKGIKNAEYDDLCKPFPKIQEKILETIELLAKPVKRR